MNLKQTTALVLTGMALASPALAQDFEPEMLTVEETIPEGPNAIVIDFALNGSSQVFVYGSDDLKLKGNIGTGTAANMVMSKDGSTLYTAGIYMERYLRGPSHAILEAWDLDTLNLKKEIELSGKLAQAETQPGLLRLSPDETLMLVQNATPATSVSVVNLETGEEVAEIPAPGCWTINPAAEGQRFSMLCGDGKIASVSYEADGSFSDFARSEQVFDPIADPLFANPVRVDGKLVFVSFGGGLYFVDDSGETPVLDKTVQVNDGIDGWVPGGSEVIAYHAASNTGFMLMHSAPYDGSHKNPAEEIWMIDMADFSIKGRFEAHGETTLSVSGGAQPAVFGANHMGAMTKYDVTLGDAPALDFAGEVPGIGFFPALVLLDH